MIVSTMVTSVAPKKNYCWQQLDPDLSRALLSKTKRHGAQNVCEAGATSAQTLGNAFNSVVGSGLLGIPYAVSCLGLRSGFAMMTVLAMMSCYTALQLSSLSAEFGRSQMAGYEELMEIAYGMWGRRLSALLLYSELIGVVGIFLTLVGSSLAALGLVSTSSSGVLLAALLTLPCLALRDFQALSRLSFLGVAALMTCVAGVLADSVSSWSKVTATGTVVIPIRQQISAMGILILSYAAHGQFPSLRASMAQPDAFPGVLLTTFAAASVLNAFFGIGAAWSYGVGRTPELVLEAMTQGWMKQICLSMIMLNTLLKVPLPTFAASVLFERRGIAFFPARCAVLALATGLSLKVPGFAQLMGLVGLVTGAGLVFVLPAMLELRLRAQTLGAFRRLCNCVLVSVGINFAMLGLYAAVR